MTEHPIKKAMNKPNVAGRLVQWAIELNQFEIEYKPWSVIEAQVLVDFIAEFTFLGDDQMQFWTVHADGSFVKELGGTGVIMISLDKDVLKYGVQLQFAATNNNAEYKAILTSLRLAKALGIKSLMV